MNFFEKYKKIFLLVGFGFVVLLLGYVLYLTFFAPPSAIKTQETETPTGTTGLPTAGEGSGQIIDDEPIKKPTKEQKKIKEPSDKAQGGVTKTEKITDIGTKNMTMNGSNLQYYDEIHNAFYKLDANGKPELLSDKKFYDVENIVWAPESDKAILEYPDGANIVYDFKNGRQITLPKHWEEFSFSTTGNKIVAKSSPIDYENNWLIVSNYDGTNVKAVEHLGMYGDKVIPSWSPNGQSVAVWTEGKDLNRQDLFFVGLNGENFKSTIIEGRNFEHLWAPDGKQILYSVTSTNNDLKPTLWVVEAKGDRIGQNRRMLNVETWASKCTFSGKSEVYCAVPTNIERGAGMFPQLIEDEEDYIYRIDIDTGKRQLVAIPEKAYNISDIRVSEDGSNLYFSSSGSQEIYKVRLK